MRPNSSSKPKWHFIILGLLILGLIVQFISRPGSILIPLIILGVVYYLYKRPPAWLQKFAYGSHSGYKIHQKQKKTKKKPYRFRVIDGKKKSI